MDAVITDPWFYAVAVPAVALAGISKAGFGGGLGVMATPLIALVIGPVQAAAIMLPVLMLMDAQALWHFRGRWDVRNFLILLGGSVVGIGIGAATFRFLDADAIRLIVGAVALVFSLRFWLDRRAAARPPTGRSVPRGGFWGTVAGFTSFVAHAGGPPVSVYLLPQRLDKTVFVGTTVLFYASINVLKVPPYAYLGQFTGQTLLTALVLAPVAPLGMWLGLRLHHRIPQEPFYKVCYAFLLLTGLKLLWDGSQGLFPG